MSTTRPSLLHNKNANFFIGGNNIVSIQIYQLLNGTHEILYVNGRQWLQGHQGEPVSQCGSYAADPKKKKKGT